MKKKLLATMLATSMVMGTSLCAFAEEVEPEATGDLESVEAVVGGAQVEGNSDITLPVIKVVVPTTASVVLNPYKMKYTPEGGEEASDQIVSVEQSIKSYSNVALDVNVSALKGSSDNVTFLTAPYATKPVTTKSVFMYLEMTGEEGTYNESGFDSSKTPTAKQVLVGTKDAAKAGMGTLDAVEAIEFKYYDHEGGDLDEEGYLASLETETPGYKVVDTENTEPTEVYFKLLGDMVPNPTSAWLATDTVNVSWKFTFTPQVNE